ncbi:MAG: DUF5683 domain-containing protein [Prevotella sp.]
MFFRLIIAFIFLLTGFHTASAQKDSIEAALPDRAVETLPEKSVETLIDSVSQMLPKADSVATVDIRKIAKRDWTTWTPNPNRALWLALVIPGGGQIYNRKYWKLPIIYGGMMGCIYALTWNNMMYRDYSQAYLDIMDSDPNTQSYNKFLHLGATITEANEERYKTLFKSRKDKYRRWRDMSMFCLIGVYALSVIDAYVDAELSEFDISKDLSLKVAPTVIPGGSTFSSGSLENSAVGVNLGLRF